MPFIGYCVLCQDASTSPDKKFKSEVALLKHWRDSHTDEVNAELLAVSEVKGEQCPSCKQFFKQVKQHRCAQARDNEERKQNETNERESKS